MVVIDGSASATFQTPLPVSQGGTGSALSGAAPGFLARAWCVFDGGLAGTNAPLAGGNVSTITRNATGDYTINFTTAMPDAYWAAFITFNQNGSGANSGFVNTASIVAGSVSIFTTVGTTGAINPSRVYVVVYR